MDSVTVVNLAYLQQQLETEAQACASERKSGFRNLFTRKDSLYQECKTGLMQGKYKSQLDEAYAKQNTDASKIDAVFMDSVGLSKQTITILTAALVVLIITIIIFLPNKTKQ